METSTAPREAAIQKQILALPRSIPGLVLRKTLGSAYRRGTPDLLGCYRGRALALEIKRPGGRATALQEAELAAWQAAGAIAGVVCSPEQVRVLLEGVG